MRKRKLLALAVIAAIVAVPSAQAHSGTGNGWKTVATGLDNPRGLAFGPGGAGFLRLAYTQGEADLRTGLERMAAYLEQQAG